MRIIHSTGPVPCPYALIAERPGKVEARVGRVLCGPSGEEVDRYLRNNSGIDRASIFCSNVVRDWRDDEPPSPEEIRRDIPELARELLQVKPRYVMLMGLYAARAVLGPEVTMEWANGLCFPYAKCSLCGEIYPQGFEPNRDRGERLLALDRSNDERRVGDPEESSPLHVCPRAFRESTSVPLSGTNRPNTPWKGTTSHMREYLVCEPMAPRASDEHGAPRSAPESDLQEQPTCDDAGEYAAGTPLPGMSAGSNTTVEPRQRSTQVRIQQRLGKGASSTCQSAIQTIQAEQTPICFMPVIHASAGLHQPAIAAKVAWGFEQFGKLCRGDVMPTGHLRDAHQDPWYDEASSLIDCAGQLVAVDTEGSINNPWCLSLCGTPGRAIVRRGDVKIKNNPSMLLHSALHDLPVLASMGVTPSKWTDTLLMAALLQVEPQGLKALARRHAGMVMSDYDSVVAPARREKALEYLGRVVDYVVEKEKQ